MNSLNSVLIEGHLTADPEKKVMESGATVATFTVATNRQFTKDGERKTEVSFFAVEVWNNTAVLCLKNLSKGRGVRVVGRLKQDRWADKEGVSHSKVKEEQEASAAKLKADQEAFAKQQHEAHEASERAERERLAKVAEDERQARLKAEAETLRLKTEADAKLKAEEEERQSKLKAEADAKASEAEKARLAALAPDKEKILAWLAEFETIEQPDLVDGAMVQLLRETVADIANLFRDVRGKLK